jgi:hypothetical protein
MTEAERSYRNPAPIKKLSTPVKKIQIKKPVKD